MSRAVLVGLLSVAALGCTASGDPSTARPAPAAPAAAAPAAPAAPAHDLVIRNRAAIEACLRKDLPEVSLRITINERGTATTLVEAKTEVPDEVKRCVIAAVDKLPFAPAATTVTVDIAR